jgi:hypothetical protein
MEGTISFMQGRVLGTALCKLVSTEHAHDRLSSQSDTIVYLEMANRYSEVEALRCNGCEER